MRSRSYLYPFIILLLVLLYYYYLKVAQIVILSYFRPLSNSILVKNGTFSHFKLVCDGLTDGRTDRRTDGWTHPLIEMRERILKWFGNLQDCSNSLSTAFSKAFEGSFQFMSQIICASVYNCQTSRVSLECMESYLNSFEVLKIAETACQLHP